MQGRDGKGPNDELLGIKIALALAAIEYEAPGMIQQMF